MHEIITLQLGQQSNYIATHFWNTQESYFTYAENEESQIDHDIHWRPGLGADGSETYMPRTVIYDLKGGFGSLRKINALYDITDDNPAASSSLWGGQTVVQKAEPIAPSAYQQSLDAGLAPAPLTPATVRYWSDFNRVFYHPRSIVQLNDYELNSALQPFERWATGEDLFASLDKEHDIMDRDLRPFAEEADQLQGLQVFTTLDDAWGGFVARYVERLRDEFGKAPVWVWGAHQGPAVGAGREKRLLRLVNKARALTELSRQASLLVPIALPAALSSSAPPPRLRRMLAVEAASAWHTAALLSAAVESATLPTRLKDAANRDVLGNISDRLNVHGKQTVANLQMSFAGAADVPRSESAGGAATDAVKLDLDFRPADSVAGGASGRPPKIFSQVLASRGARAKDEADDGIGDHDARMRWRGHQGETVGRRYRSTLAYPLPDSFPEVFRDDGSGGGEALRGGVAVTTALSTDAALTGRLRALRTTVTRHIGLEEREALSNELAEMAEEYHEGWSSGSDLGDDD